MARRLNPYRRAKLAAQKARAMAEGPRVWIRSAWDIDLPVGEPSRKWEYNGNMARSILMRQRTRA